MRLADTLRGAGRAAAAATAYERVVDLDPRWSPAWIALAELAAARGDADGERTILRRAVAADSVALLSRLACREAASTPPADPTPWLERALELDPTASEPWLVRGDLALAANRPQEAVTAFTRAAELDPTRAEAALGVGRALMAAGEADRARPHLLRAAVLGRGTPVEREAQAALESLTQAAAIETAESH
jgi:cytochrome c-type biogenesis protein CcmH/NrfG